MSGIVGCPANEFQSLGTEQHRSFVLQQAQQAKCVFFSSVFFRRYLKSENVKTARDSKTRWPTTTICQPQMITGLERLAPHKSKRSSLQNN